VTVTDANGCTAVDSVEITEDASDIVAVAPDITLDCFGDLADIDLSVSGGINGTYVVDWDNDGTGDNDDPEDLTGVPAGTYNVTITENVTGCEEYHTVIITQPMELVVTAVGDSAICGGMPSGSYTITIAGGTGPYDYIDNDTPVNSGTNVTGPTIAIAMVGAGSYSITVTDANGCTDVTSVTIDEAPVLSASVTA
jgi:hypothetical protein